MTVLKNEFQHLMCKQSTACVIFTEAVNDIYLLRSVRLSEWVSFLSWSCRHWSLSRSPPASSLHPNSCFSSFSSPSCRGHPHWIAWWLLPRSSAARRTCSPDSSDVGPTEKHIAHTYSHFFSDSYSFFQLTWRWKPCFSQSILQCKPQNTC